MRICSTLVALFLFCLMVGKGVYWSKDGFSAARVCSIRSGETGAIDSETDKILAQTFHYLGRGRQFFAFASADNKYVLKLPRTDIYRNPLWHRSLPFKQLRKTSADDRIKRKKFILQSMHLAANDLKEETALLAIHLRETRPNGQILNLTDRIGRTIRLSAHKTSFILQKKQELFFKLFLTASKEEKKGMLDQLYQSIAKRNLKSIGNKDHSFLKNYGYDGKTVVQLDLGSFIPNSSQTIKSICEEVEPIYTWLKTHDAEMAGHFNQITSDRLSEVPR